MKLKAIALLALSSLAAPSYAALYDVNFATTGSSGFGASLFHDASGSNHMSGPTVADITHGVPGDGPVGTYDDVTGQLFVTLNTVATNGVSTDFTLSGTVLFDQAGVLANNSTLAIDFLTDGVAPLLVDGNIGFNAGYVCCGSTNSDPNSFIAQESIRGNYWMTLWGANVFTGTQPWDGEYDSKTNLGMDIRLDLTPSRNAPAVPVPAAAWLFGSGLLGLVGVARRKTV